MPTANAATLQEMFDRARDGKFAYPSFNVHDLFTANAAIEGLGQSSSDGIVQIHPNPAVAVTGSIEDPFLGALSLADHTRRMADRFDVNIAIHTDHCDSVAAPRFLDPLLDEARSRDKRGQPRPFTSHMFDGSALGLQENLAQSAAYLERCRELDLWLEIEIGVIGDEHEDAVKSGNGQVFSEPEDFLAVRRALGAPAASRYSVAPAFGNVHGVYRPGEVTLQPEVLGRCQARVREEFGDDFYLVFHGGSGSGKEDIQRAIEFGTVKMNFDTDGQYAFTRAVADYMFKAYDRILRIDGDPGDKLAYFTETWLLEGQEAMKEFVVSVCRTLGCAGNSMK